MWGRGREGQLGSGLHCDSALPLPVADLQGRHVLQVAPAPRFHPAGPLAQKFSLTVFSCQKSAAILGLSSPATCIQKPCNAYHVHPITCDTQERLQLESGS